MDASFNKFRISYIYKVVGAPAITLYFVSTTHQHAKQHEGDFRQMLAQKLVTPLLLCLHSVQAHVHDVGNLVPSVSLQPQTDDARLALGQLVDIEMKLPDQLLLQGQGIEFVRIVQASGCSMFDRMVW